VKYSPSYLKVVFLKHQMKVSLQIQSLCSARSNNRFLLW